MVDRESLIVDLSGDQKNVLGFASWTQVSITAIGMILGIIAFSLINGFFSLIGTSGGVATLFGFIGLCIFLGPAAYIAFVPVRTKQGDLLFYKYKQILINYNFERNEIGTYINIKKPQHQVNSRFSYVQWKKERGY